MKSLITGDILKVSWTSAGFSSPQKKYAFKLSVQDGILTTLVTDFVGIYVEESPLGKKFSQLNAKLSGPDDILLSKVREVLKLNTSKHTIDSNPQKRSLTINAENTVGKRVIKWQFDGKSVEDNGRTFYQLVVRPLMEMVSFAAERRQFDFTEGLPKVGTLRDPFEMLQVQELYQVIVSRPEYVVDTTEYRIASKDETVKKERVEEKPKSRSPSLPSTPPPAEEEAPSSSQQKEAAGDEDSERSQSVGRKRTAGRKPKKGRPAKKAKATKEKTPVSEDDGSMPPTPPPAVDEEPPEEPPVKEQIKEEEEVEEKAPSPVVTPKKAVRRKPKLRF